MKQFLNRKLRSLAKKIVGYTIRWQLLIYLKIKKIEKGEAFHAVFGKLNKIKLINYLLPLCEHRHQLSNREYLLLEIVKRMGKMGQDYVPALSFNGSSDIFEAIKNQPSVLITTVHNGFAFTSKFVSSLSRRVTTIAADPEYVQEVVFKRTGISSDLTIINRDKFCLAKLLDAIRNKNIICCDIDYPKSTHEKFKYVSPALFIFAEKNRLPVYFAKYDISDTGNLQLSFKASFSGTTPEDKLADFIEFINSTREVKRQLFPSKF